MHCNLRVNAFVLALVLLVTGCTRAGGGAGGADGEPVDGAGIRIAIGQEPPNLDPQLVDNAFERAANDNIYETLITRNADGELTADGLAADMPEHVELDTWQFTLREGITWHNGEPFTADDVVASVERIIDPDFGSEQGSFFATITGAEKVGETTVNITTNGPDPVLPSRMYWMKIIPVGASDQEEFAENPIGTGPYRFVEWARGDSITIERNEDYWGQNASNIETVTYNFVPEASTRLSGLVSGQYNLAPNLLPEDIEAAPKFATLKGLEHALIVLNERGGITEDVRVRRALNLAVDKESIVENIFQGFATVDPCQPMDSAWFGFHPDLEPYPYDPEQASQLLEEAGVTGEDIELLSTTGRWLKDREVIEAVANFWRDAGLRVNVRIFEVGEFNRRMFHGGKNIPDTVFMSSSNEIFDADRNLTMLFQPNFLAAANDNPRMEELLNEARTETDEEKRQSLYEQVLEISCEEGYLVNLYNNEDIYGMTENLEWKPRVDGKMLVKEMEIK